MSPSLKRAARLPHGPRRPAVPIRARPSSNRGHHASSRASRPKRVSLDLVKKFLEWRDWELTLM